MSRTEHEFQFQSHSIAKAAKEEAEYHEERLRYWQDAYENAAEVVEATIGAKLVRQPITGGFQVSVVVDYGDKDAYDRMQQAFQKISDHRAAAERFRSDEKVYGTQNDRVYELSLDDVHYYRLGGGPRED
jgi:hypothetical protein